MYTKILENESSQNTKLAHAPEIRNLGQEQKQLQSYLNREYPRTLDESQVKVQVHNQIYFFTHNHQ